MCAESKSRERETRLRNLQKGTAMATAQLARVIEDRVIQYEDAALWQLEGTGERKPRMSWVVVTGKDGGRRLRIQWS